MDVVLRGFAHGDAGPQSMRQAGGDCQIKRSPSKGFYGGLPTGESRVGAGGRLSAGALLIDFLPGQRCPFSSRCAVPGALPVICKDSTVRSHVWSKRVIGADCNPGWIAARLDDEQLHGWNAQAHDLVIMS